MKNFKFTLLFFALTMFFMAPTAEAVHPVKTHESTVIDGKAKAPVAAKKLTKKQLRKQKRWTRRFNRLKKKLAKKGIDFGDPVYKWLWFSLGAFLAAILLWIIAAASVTSGHIGGFGILGILSLLLWLAGGVFFIIWLVKVLS